MGFPNLTLQGGQKLCCNVEAQGHSSILPAGNLHHHLEHRNLCGMHSPALVQGALSTRRARKTSLPTSSFLPTQAIGLNPEKTAKEGSGVTERGPEG